MKPIRNWLLLFAAALLVACAQLGLVQPETLTEKVATAKALNTEIVKQATVLLNTGKISSADAENVLKGATTASDGIKVAQSLALQDPAAANARLTMVVTVLTSLQAYLAVHNK